MCAFIEAASRENFLAKRREKKWKQLTSLCLRQSAVKLTTKIQFATGHDLRRVKESVNA